ncbi:hypothetical protein IT575_08310 [bacterium]|nr:hypothetical protein [bacterium]
MTASWKRRDFLSTIALFGAGIGSALAAPARPSAAEPAMAPAAAAAPFPRPSAVPANRSQLISLLAAACEIEHSVSCIYLYAASSLKTWESDGLPADKRALVSAWSAELHRIAREEMYHLVQGWNLLTAVGGTPYCLHPNFPQGADFTPVGVPLMLESVSRDCLQRCVTFERPGDGDQPDTVAELYDLIEAGFRNLADRQLFVGNPVLQADPLLSGFSELVPVTDLESALKACEIVKLQGEGTEDDRSTSHYGTFSRLLQEYDQELASGASATDLAYPCISSPSVRNRGDFGAAGHTVIQDEDSAAAAALFESSYALMLQILQHSFTTQDRSAEESARHAQQSYMLMKEVIGPLGEQLCRLPSGIPGLNAGPCYGLFRQVSLPADAALADQLIRERFGELGQEAALLAAARPELEVLTSSADMLTMLGQI